MSYDTTDVLDLETREAIDIDRTKGDFTFPERNKFDAGRGLTSATVDYISDVKNDPDWVREFRHKALEGLPGQADAHPLGDEGSGEHRFRHHPLLSIRRREAEALVGRCARRRAGNLRASRHSRSRSARSSPAWKRSSTREAAYSNVKEELTKHGVIFVQLHRRPEGARGDLPPVVRQGHPDRRQQVLRAQQRGLLRRLLHLRARRA